MAWLKKIPGLSLILLLLTYAVTGWMYASWATKLSEGMVLARLGDKIGLSFVYGVAVATITFLVIVFTAPISMMTISLDGWLKSETRAFISIFIGAFAFTIIVQQVDHFAQFLVLLATALLFKLDLQLVGGCNRWLCSLILIIFCLLGFTGGILAFHVWSS